MKHIFALLTFLFCGVAQAQDALVVQTCGTLPLAYAPGATRLLTVDTTGKLCGSGGGGGGTPANPTATAGPTAVNGVLTTYMRSDAAPAIQLGSSSQAGLLQVDNATITAAAGIISTVPTTVLTSTQTGSNYAFLTGDLSKVVYLNSASVQVPTIAQAGTTGFATGWFTSACNIGAGTQTITPATSTIGGAATYVLAAGSAAAPKCVTIISNGTNYLVYPAGGSGTPGGSTTQVQFNDAGAFNGDANILLNKTNHTLAFGGITSSFGAISGPCTQCLSTNRVGLRLADDSGWAVGATAGLDLMSGGNRNGIVDTGGGGLRFMTDSATGIDFIATASGGGALNGNGFSGAHSDLNHSLQTPATGFSITLANNIWHTILDPAGTLATGTITLPALPRDGMITNVRASQIVTSLTVSPNSGQSVKGAPSSFAVGGIMECIYHEANTTWYC